MFEELLKNLKQGQKKLNDLSSDIERVKGNSKSKSSIRPLTIIRKDTEEIDKAKENPDLTFVEDQLNSILSNITK